MRKEVIKEEQFSYVIFSIAVILNAYFIYRFKFHLNVAIFSYFLLTLLCEFFPVRFSKSGSVTIGSVIIIASWLSFAPKYGPVPSIIITFFASLIPDIKNKKKFHLILFNLGQYTLAVGLAAFVYFQLQAVKIPLNFPVPIFAFVLSVLVYHGLNSYLVSASISLAESSSIWRTWLDNIYWTFPNLLSIVVLALVFYELFRQPNYGYFSVALLLVPLVIARQMYQYYTKLKSAYTETVSSLIKAVEAKDRYTKGHSERVSEVSVKIGRELNLSNEDIESLKRIATLHDIGKIGVPKRILTKPSELSEEEFALVKDHPKIGAQILKNLEFLKDLLPAVFYHHERIDGTGYSSGLAGENIPLFARIIAVADAYDAMTSNRAYRTALSRQEVIAEFKEGSGKQFDTPVVEALFRALNLHEEEKISKEEKLVLQPEQA